jgi:hypothetical protein
VERPGGILYALNLAMACLFLLSAGLQLNDPDPFVWIAYYVAAAAACVVAWRFEKAWIAAAAMGAVGAIWAAVLLPDILGHIGFTDLFDKMHMKGGRVEVGREVGGLAIAVAWLAALAIIQVRARKRS